jgi:hypothetical protein
VYIHACHARVIKFPMALIDHRVQGNELMYKLPEHEEDGIRNVIVAIKL